MADQTVRVKSGSKLRIRSRLEQGSSVFKHLLVFGQVHDSGLQKNAKPAFVASAPANI